MRIQLPAVICFMGGLYNLYFASKLRKFKVPATPPKSRAHLSVEQRQRKVQIGVRLFAAVGFCLIVGAVILFGLEN